MTSHDDQIRSLLATDERSLNTSDAALAATCYTADGIFMPTALPTAEGADMEGAYQRIFDAIRLAVTFVIDELVATSDHNAYALTRSTGTQTVLATGDQTAESNREIFLFRRTDDGWKIAPAGTLRGVREVLTDKPAPKNQSQSAGRPTCDIAVVRCGVADVEQLRPGPRGQP